METNPQPAPVAAKTSGLAIASLITGLTCLSPLAIVFGHMALSKIKKSAGALGGGGMALAGLILGYVTLVLNLAFVIPVLVVGANAWQKGAERAVCTMNQRNIEQMIHGYAGINQLEEGASIDLSKVLEYFEVQSIETTCPQGGELTISPVYLGPNENHVQCVVENHEIVTDFGH